MFDGPMFEFPDLTENGTLLQHLIHQEKAENTNEIICLFIPSINRRLSTEE